MDPKVSIAVPVYNGEDFLEQAVRSVVEQDFRDVEVIICDNASEDNTRTISERFSKDYAHISYHRHPKNIGAGPNFNKAFLLTKGEYFKWVAHDDWISSDYIKLCAEALDRNPDAVLAHGVTQCVDQAGHPIDSIGYELPGLQADSPVERLDIVLNGALACFEIFGLIRREALRKTELHQSYHDSDRALIAELALLGKFVQVPDARMFNRDHPKRSIRIVTRRERLRWQDAKLSRRMSALPRWSLLRHCMRMVFRHLRGADRARGVLVILRWFTRRNQLLELTVDLVHVLSPGAATRLRKTAWEVWWAFRALAPRQ